MKKLILLFLATILIISLCSCGGGGQGGSGGDTSGEGNIGDGSGDNSGGSGEGDGSGDNSGDNSGEGDGSGDNSGGSDEGDGSGDNSGDSGEDADDPLLIQPGETVYILAGELVSNSHTSRLAEALTALLSIAGEGGAVISETTGTAANTITILLYESGALSEYGDALLASVSKDSPFEIAYAIYAEGGAITVVYEECEYAFISGYDQLIDSAITALTADSRGISVADGEIALGKIDLYALQCEIDEDTTDTAWAEIEAKLGKDTAEALKLLYTLYPDSIADWAASMYSRGYIDLDKKVWVGGYYESTSGRVTDGFGPDVEATSQMLTFLAQSGMIDHLGGRLKVAIPEWMQREIIYFAKSLQDTNGYFYHPQWSMDATNSNIGRRGRDLGWAVSILSTFGAKPTYDTPSGERGDGITADGYLAGLGISPVRLTESVNTSVAVAVSRVVSVADDNTSFLRNFEEFIDYVHSKDVDSKPYHSTFNATYKQIAAQSAKMGVYTPSPDITEEKYLRYSGLTMKEILIKYLNDTINPKTGLWGKDWEEYNAALDAAGDTETARKRGTEFKYTNGLHGHIPIYNQWKIPYPYIEEATLSVLDGLMGDEESTGNICELYNQWFCIVELKSNATKYHGADGERILGIIDAALKENGAYAVANTYSKLKGYKKADGGFAHNVNSGTAKNQGMPTGLGLNESNVDAVCIGVTGMTRTIFSAFGATRVPIYTTSDYMRYLYILNTNAPALKGEASCGRVEFDDGETGGVSCDGEMHTGDGKLHISPDTVNITVPKSNVRNIGQAIYLGYEATLYADGEYVIALSDAEGTVCEVSLTVSDGKIWVRGYDSAISLREGGRVEISMELSSDTTANAYMTINGTSVTVNLDLAGGRVAFNPSEITSARLTKPYGDLTLDWVLLTQMLDRTLRFDTMPDNTAIKYTNGSSIPENTLTVTERDDKSVLLYHREVNHDGTQSYFDLMATYTIEGARSVRFETDMKITNVTSKSYIEFVLMPYAASKDNRVYKAAFTLGANADGSRIYYCDASISGGYTQSRDTGVTVGEWFNLAIECTMDESGKIVTHVYINGELFHETDLVYGSEKEPSEINSVRFAPHTPFMGEIYFDNMSLIQS